MGNCLLLGFHAKWPLALPAFVVDICFDGSGRDRIMGKQKKNPCSCIYHEFNVQVNSGVDPTT